MKTTLSQPPKDWREARRLRAWELHLQGWSQSRISDALGVTQGAISQWIHRALSGAQEALRSHTGSGAPCRLSKKQLQLLPKLLAKGAEDFGYRGDVWTCARVATVIERTWNVRYHRCHVSRLLHDIGWSSQRPVVRASQRDEPAIATWKAERLPAIKKNP